MQHSLEAITGLRISVASPEQMYSWSSGEVTSAETLNYLTQQPVPGGLFCERIFGPTRDWSCFCGKYRRERTPGFTCEVCGVEITKRMVRRERMGHIELAVPVAHPWYVKAIPNIIALLLDLSPRSLRSVLSYSAYMVTSIDEEQRHLTLATVNADSEEAQDISALLRSLALGAILEESFYRTISRLYGRVFWAETGAEAIRRRLSTLDLDALVEQLRQTILQGGMRQKNAIKRLHLVEAFRAGGVDPAWMVLSVIPVLPPDLRPLVPLPGGRYMTSDVNILYERVLHRNDRIKAFLAKGAPDIVLNHEKRLLQDACDALFDNARRMHPLMGSDRQPLKSLTDTLKGKGGIFRHNLLGKRVDYSGRSVISVGLDLQLHQCGLPTSICLELFKPFLIRRLLERNCASTVRAAKRMVERTRELSPIVWEALEEVMRGKVVLLNRAPTLHRLSIQAFEAVRVEGSAIRLHPLVCSAFNADFDGDQMAVHLPLSDEAEAEARSLLLSTRNLRSPASGEPAISISQEMVLGLFYLTQERVGAKSTGRVFSDASEALLALHHGVIDLHTRLFVRIDDWRIYDAPGNSAPPPLRKRLETTAGRLIFNDVLPPELRYKNYEMTKERLKQLVAECLLVCGESATAQSADGLKTLGFTYATRSGVSFAMSDVEVPAEKQAVLARADAEVESIDELFNAGMITTGERSRQRIDIWTRATDEVSRCLERWLDPWGSLATILTSGATKATFQQIRQLAGMRGLMARPSGEIIDIPIRGNYLEGLTVREAFIAASAARNGFMGRSLNTAVTGYLTRKLVETGMEVWVTTEDCGTRDGLLVTQKECQAAGIADLRSRVIGCVLAEPVANLPAGLLLDETHLDRIMGCGMAAMRVRSVVSCQASYGVCRHCYGSDLATGKLVRMGAAVGIVAGQSIGEPGTQLSMRAFHSGGIANAQGDIRQGLPRVIDLFEVRPPANAAILARQDGCITALQEMASGGTLITSVDATGEVWSTTLPAGRKPIVGEGQHVEVGTPFTRGTADPRVVLELLGCEAAARFIVNEVQQVFRGTGVYLADKHIECIVRQMLRFVEILDAGDTSLLPGQVVDRFSHAAATSRILVQGGTPATARPLLLGLTQAVLHTQSWVAAASFQETSRVLTQAAIRGQRDDLVGWKERIVVGKGIPMRACE